MSSNSQGGGLGRFVSSEPIPVVFALVILLALIGLALLRHFFAGISVSAGTK
jgi:hypothetical protein